MVGASWINPFPARTKATSSILTPALPADKWTHVVAVYSASRRIQKLYANGQEVASKGDGTFPPLVVTSVPLQIGADPNGNNRFQGRVQRAAIYGRALTAEEITRRAADPVVLSGVLGDWQLTSAPEAAIRPLAGALILENGKETTAFVGESSAPREPLSLWYRGPAQKWEEALPLGNGRLGGHVSNLYAVFPSNQISPPPKDRSN